MDQSRHVDGLQPLRDTGQIVRDGWLCTPNGALILRVAATDVDYQDSLTTAGFTDITFDPKPTPSTLIFAR